MQIERQNAELSTHSAPSTKFVGQRVSALWAATNSYGKPCDGALLQAWEIVIRLNEITPQEFSAGVEFFINEGGDMPTPGRFRRWVSELRSEAARREWQLAMKAQIEAEEEENERAYRERHPERENWTTDDYRKHMARVLEELESKFKQGEVMEYSS